MQWYKYASKYKPILAKKHSPPMQNEQKEGLHKELLHKAYTRSSFMLRVFMVGVGTLTLTVYSMESADVESNFSFVVSTA